MRDSGGALHASCMHATECTYARIRATRMHVRDMNGCLFLVMHASAVMPTLISVIIISSTYVLAACRGYERAPDLNHACMALQPKHL
jgi:hypothetical protein